MSDCPTCEYHKQRAQIWRDEVYRLTGHPLPRKGNSMTHEEQIAKLTEMLEIQQKLHETAIEPLRLPPPWSTYLAVSLKTRSIGIMPFE